MLASVPNKQNLHHNIHYGTEPSTQMFTANDTYNVRVIFMPTDRTQICSCAGRPTLTVARIVCTPCTLYCNMMNMLHIMHKYIVVVHTFMCVERDCRGAIVFMAMCTCVCLCMCVSPCAVCTLRVEKSVLSVVYALR